MHQFLNELIKSDYSNLAIQICECIILDSNYNIYYINNKMTNNSTNHNTKY